MKSPPYRAQFVGYVLAMMADNVEHVISYWVDGSVKRIVIVEIERDE